MSSSLRPLRPKRRVHCGLVIPLPLQCVLCSILLIFKLVQSPVDFVFFHLPLLLRRTLGTISLVIVIIFLALERVLSSLPLGVKSIIRGILRPIVVLFRTVDRLRHRSRGSWTVLPLRYLGSGLLRLDLPGTQRGSGSPDSREIYLHDASLPHLDIGHPHLIGNSRGSNHHLMPARRKNSLDR